jgi:adenylyl-sulfate kinase
MSNEPGRIVWFTGLSGAGKSTLCIHLAAELERLGRSTHILDGDDLRRGLCVDLGFSAADRAENVRRAMHVAGLLAAKGDIVLVALITPFLALRDMARIHFPTMLEVFVDAPLAVCEQRDPKGLYKRARAGELSEFTGLNSPFERPVAPDLVCRTDQETVRASVAKVMEHLLGAENTRTPPNEGRRKTVAVDFDGVIADYNGWKGADSLGPPRRDVLDALRQLRQEGWKIIVHTTRGAESIRSYLIDAGVPFDQINENSDYETGGQKPVATVYWDDRAVRYSGDAARDLNVIRSFRTWCARR